MAEYEAESLSLADVQTAAGLCGNGDTLVLPSGDVNWAGPSLITLNYHISIRGQGVASTIITRTLEDENPPTFQWYLPEIETPPQIEVQGFTLNGVATVNQDTGLFFFYPYYAAPLKIHDIDFNECGMAGIYLNGYCTGVIYDCNFIDCYYAGAGYGVCVSGNHPDDDPDYGDWVWTTWPAATDPGWGTADFMFIEDCYFNGCRHSLTSCYGGKYVMRHCTSLNSGQGEVSGLQHIDTHGKGAGYRGTRAVEIYGNTVGNPDRDYYTDGFVTHGGDCLVYDNSFGVWISDSALMVDDNNITEYPDPDQMRGGYFWDNTSTVHGDIDSDYFPTNPYGVYVINSSTYIQDDRDIFLEEYSYIPYAYPHPLRGGGGFSVGVDGGSYIFEGSDATLTKGYVGGSLIRLIRTELR